MTKTAIATFVIWSVGLCSASALAYTLVKKPVAPPQAATPKESAGELFLSNIDHFKVPKPAVVQPSKVRAHLSVKPHAKRPAANMKCSSWKSMATSVDQSVRYCQ